MTSKSTKGIVCFADILGYVNIIENNDIDNCAEIINNIIFGLEDRIKSKMEIKDQKYETANKEIEEFIESKIKITVVSDSILLFFDINEKEINNGHVFPIITFYLIYFIQDCFKKGIPIRACIDYGEFYLNNNVFAGLPVINGYKITNDMNFSGLVITEETYKIFYENLSTKNNKECLQERFCKYLVQFKNIEKKVYILDWIDVNDFEDNDIKQILFESFHCHNKDVNSSALKKIEDTEKTIRFFLMERKKVKTH